MEVATLAAQRQPPRWRPLGQRLASARQRAGLTQEELAERIGRTQGYVASVEGGLKRPRPETLEDFARALGEPIGELLVEGDYVAGTTGLPEQQAGDALDRQWHTLPPRLKRRALRLLETFLEEDAPDDGSPEAREGDER